MKLHTALVTAALLLIVTACRQNDGPPTRNSVGIPPSAPIVIEGEPGPRSMTLHISFLTDSPNVEVEVYGIDGLVVTSARMEGAISVHSTAARHDGLRPGPA